MRQRQPGNLIIGGMHHIVAIKKDAVVPLVASSAATWSIIAVGAATAEGIVIRTKRPIATTVVLFSIRALVVATRRCAPCRRHRRRILG